MAKAPAIQFYVKDWLSDPQLKRASFATRGIWIDMICFMWSSPEPGKITGTEAEIAKLLGATIEEIQTFLSEAEKLGFCDVTKPDVCVTKKDVTRPLRDCYAIVTIVNRRMNRTWKDKESARMRMQKMRGFDDPLRDFNGNVQAGGSERGVVVVGSISIKEKIKYLDCVFLTAEEFQKLVAKNGQFLTDKAISILNNYIMGKGKDSYKSHYHTLIGWPMERAVEKYGGGKGDSGRGSGIQTTPAEWIPEAPISEEQRLANQKRVKDLIGGKYSD